MPIKIPDDPSLAANLRRERVPVITEAVATRQDIRPLRIALVNIMPTQVYKDTATQFARLLGATPLQIDLTLVRPASYPRRRAADAKGFVGYVTPEDIREERYDGVIFTGAPIEHLPFAEVVYWRELTRMFDWAKDHAHSTVGVCWGAQALLHHRHGVPKHDLQRKAFGCIRHRNRLPHSPFLRGFADDFIVPVSRHTEVRRADIPTDRGLEILIESEETGLCLLEEAAIRSLYMFNHIEYDTGSLHSEFVRDRAKRDMDPPIHVPANYYPGDDPGRPPVNRWRSHAHLLFGNWLNEVYQSTPFEIGAIGRDPRG